VDLATAFIVAIAGYFMGAVSFARVVARAVNPTVSLDEARKHTTGTGEAGTVSGIGASTASIALGKKYGGLVALLDMLKAFIPIVILRFVFPDQPHHLVFSVLAIIGHIYPVYYRFNGGRGLSPMLGSLLAIEPIGMVVALLAGSLAAILINQPHAALIIWFPFLTLWSWLVRNDIPAAIFSIALLALFLIAEIPEIRLALQYRKQGRMDEYNQMILNSAPQTRMMKRLAEKVRFWDKKKTASSDG
jgi:acyl phosphate:glycerol-3-phosphate acyltransferase